MATHQVPTLDGIVGSDDSAATPNTFVQRDGAGNVTVATANVSKVNNSGAVYNTSGPAAKTTGYSATASDYFIRADGSGGGFTVTLPAAATVTGQEITVKRVGSTGTITIQGNGAETIDGSNTVSLSTNYATRRMRSNGTSWDVIASV